MIPSYRGLAHHASTSLICCSYKASSAEPAFSASGSSWKESDGNVAVMGCSRGLREDMLWCTIENVRIMDLPDFADVASLLGRVVGALRSILTEYKEECGFGREEEAMLCVQHTGRIVRRVYAEGSFLLRNHSRGKLHPKQEKYQQWTEGRSSLYVQMTFTAPVGD